MKQYNLLQQIDTDSEIVASKQTAAAWKSVTGLAAGRTLFGILGLTALCFGKLWSFVDSRKRRGRQPGAKMSQKVAKEKFEHSHSYFMVLLQVGTGSWRRQHTRKLHHSFEISYWRGGQMYQKVNIFLFVKSMWANTDVGEAIGEPKPAEKVTNPP